MAKDNECTRMIPKIYKKSYEDLGMFFFVEGQRQIVPTITITQAIQNYHKFIGQDTYDRGCAAVTYTRLRNSFIDFNYEISKKTK